MLGHPLIHAFISAADQQQLLVSRQAARRFLVEPLPGGRDQHDPLPGIAFRPDALHRFEEWLGLQQHALAAAKRAVVDGPVTVRGPIPQIVDLDPHDSGFGGPRHYAVPERSFEEIREDRHDVKLHRSSSPSGKSTTILRPGTSISKQIERANGINKSLSPPRTSSSGGPPCSCQPSSVPVALPSRVTTLQPTRSV